MQFFSFSLWLWLSVSCFALSNRSSNVLIFMQQALSGSTSFSRYSHPNTLIRTNTLCHLNLHSLFGKTSSDKPQPFKCTFSVISNVIHKSHWFIVPLSHSVINDQHAAISFSFYSVICVYVMKINQLNYFLNFTRDLRLFMDFLSFIDTVIGTRKALAFHLSWCTTFLCSVVKWGSSCYIV